MQVSKATLVVLMLSVCLTVSRSENSGESFGSNVPKEIAKLFQDQQARIELLESALRAVSSVLLSQNNKLFASLVSALKKDSHVSSLLSSTKPLGNVTKGTSENTSPAPANERTSGPSVGLNEMSAALSKVKWAVKCSQPELFDINALADSQVTTTSSITALLNQTENSVLINWTPPNECFRYISGLWFRVFQSGSPSPLSDAHYFTVPLKCLKKSSNQSLSLRLLSNELTDENKCVFSTSTPLKECHAYTIEIVPNYQSFKGEVLKSEIVMNRTHMESITSVSIRSGSLLLHWLDNSGCSDKLQQIAIRIYDDGKADNQTVPALKIARKCFKQTMMSSNLFFLALPSENRDECAVNWKPLDACRKYTIEITSQYLSDWTGPPSIWTGFTSRERRELRFASYFPENMWSSCAQSDRYYCRRTDGYHHYSHNNCYDQLDYCNLECAGYPPKPLFCNRGECYDNEFRCGRFCLPLDVKCDGKIDCIDGSDETDCNFCYELTDTTGHITSQLNYDMLGSIHVDRYTFAGFTSVLISAPANHTIWLSFVEFETVHEVKVYDGPFSTYPLLGSFSAQSSLPSPLGSSSNHLYLHFPNYFSNKKGIEAYFFSMESEGQPFRPGCDGYVNGKGIIELKAVQNTSAPVQECVWYIEAKTKHQTLLLKTKRMSNFTLDADARLFGDWSRSNKLHLPRSWEKSTSAVAVAYTDANKAVLEFPRRLNPYSSTLPYSLRFSIQVFSLSPADCTFDLTGPSGTIKSPQYPSAYPHLSDCRWRIVTPSNTTIQLLFALFETQENYDFIYVYDGATFESPILFEGSGTLGTPFLVNSSSNEVVVRFVTDDEVAASGFLAVYTTV